ncbi:hypothetical protein Leryth_001206, partial [Lithospermum erythrorhizon]
LFKISYISNTCQGLYPYKRYFPLYWYFCVAFFSQVLPFPSKSPNHSSPEVLSPSIFCSCVHTLHSHKGLMKNIFHWL